MNQVNKQSCRNCTHYSVYIHGDGVTGEYVVVDSCMMGENIIPEDVPHNCKFYIQETRNMEDDE